MVVREHFCESVRDIVREGVLLDAVPDVEQEPSPGLEEHGVLPIALRAVGEKHDAELAADEIKDSIVEQAVLARPPCSS